MVCPFKLLIVCHPQKMKLFFKNFKNNYFSGLKSMMILITTSKMMITVSQGGGLGQSKSTESKMISSMFITTSRYRTEDSGTRVRISNSQNKKSTNKKNTLIRKITGKSLLSYFKCIKNSKTKPALTVAIPIAITTFKKPKSTWATATVSTVNTNKADITRRYTFNGTI